MSDYLKALNEKEEYQQNLRSKLKDFDVAVNISVNAIGTSKFSNYSKLLIAYFDQILSQKSSERVIHYNTWDGIQIIHYFKNANPHQFKEKMMKLEDEHPLGRLIDLDVYSNNKENSLSRDTLRKCYLCDQPAFVCQKEKNHHIDELIFYYNNEIEVYFEDLICKLIKESMLLELNLEDKFGLVTPTSTGSHQDMDYQLMVKAIEPVSYYLAKMFINGLRYNDLETLALENQKIGIIAEEEMLNVTGGINCYKGLIYNLGLIITASIYSILNGQTFYQIFDNVKEIAKLTLTDDNLNTFGLHAYQNYGFGGIRKEAFEGMPSLQLAYRTMTTVNDFYLRKSLISLIINLEDSVFLKRSGSVEKMREHQEKFIKVNFSSNEEIKELTNYCINHNLSFGGAADLLVTIIYLKKLLKIFSLI